MESKSITQNVPPLRLSCFFMLLFLCSSSSAPLKDEGQFGPLIRKEGRTRLMDTEYGAITAVDVDDGNEGTSYHIEFFDLEPDCVFLPVLLHADVVFYVQKGKGTVSWSREDDTYDMDVEQGDVYRIRKGYIFYIRSQPNSMMNKLGIYAFFGSMRDKKTQERLVAPYTSINDLILGFDKEILQRGFMVPRDIIDSLKKAKKPPSIIPYPSKNKTGTSGDWEEDIFNVLLGSRTLQLLTNNNKHKKLSSKTFNFMKEKPDVKNCHGWSTDITRKDLHALKGSQTGAFMVNLTKGSMMSPHWNPMASEIVVVIHGQGMMQMLAPGTLTTKQQRSKTIRVVEGDVLLVPRYHPVAHISFNNDSFVFVGFTALVATKNNPQYIAGHHSIFKNLDKDILAMSLNVPNTTIDDVFGYNGEGVMVDCTSCAEELVGKMEDETEDKQHYEPTGGQTGEETGPEEPQEDVQGGGAEEEWGQRGLKMEFLPRKFRG